MRELNTAVFLDRDGTINEEVGYLNSFDKLFIYSSAVAAVKLLNESGLIVVVVTNQSGVARGYFSEDFVVQVHRRIQEKLNAGGAHIDAFFYCPHHPTEGQGEYRRDCLCRKPGTGLFLEAAKKLNIDLESSYVIGDTIKDIEAGILAGSKGILVRTGYGKDTEKDIYKSAFKAAYIAEDILDAANWIIRCRNL